MAKAQSWNVEIDIGNYVLHPVKLGEFSEGDEGLIEVADGSRKYKIRDQIFAIGEVPFDILIKSDKKDYDACQNFVKSGRARDVFVTFRDAAGVKQLVFLFSQCDLTFGKKNAFDRKSKSEDMKTYNLVPSDIVEVT